MRGPAVWRWVVAHGMWHFSCWMCAKLRYQEGAMAQSRGFVGRRGAADITLPPGQYLTEEFPVLSAGPTPHVPLEQWELTVDDGKNVLRRWSWKAFRELP